MKGDTNMDNRESYRRFLKAYWRDEREKCETDQKKGIPAPEEEFVIYAAPVGKV
jgi:hypothetical protein